VFLLFWLFVFFVVLVVCVFVVLVVCVFFCFILMLVCLFGLGCCFLSRPTSFLFPQTFIIRLIILIGINI